MSKGCRSPDDPTVLTFTRRGGRVGPQMRQVLTDVVPRYSLPAEPWDFDREFPGVTDVVVEVGSGSGEATIAMAQAQPDTAIVAVEVHDRGLGALARSVDQLGLTNVRLFNGDALVALQRHVAPAALAGVRVWFPDPWPKTRHHKRRIIQRGHVALMASRLRPGGCLHVATDVAEYADVIAEVLAHAPDLTPMVVRGPRPHWRPVTKYERAGIDAGRPAQDFVYQRI